MSANLGLAQVSASQAGKTTTINDIVSAIDAAMTEIIAIDCTTMPVTVTAAQVKAAALLDLINGTAIGTLNLPTIKRLYAIRNSRTVAVNLTVGTTVVSLAAAATALVYTDSTANGLNVMSGGATSGGGGSTGGSKYWQIKFRKTTANNIALAEIGFKDTAGGAVTEPVSYTNDSVIGGSPPYPISQAYDGDVNTVFATSTTTLATTTATFAASHSFAQITLTPRNDTFYSQGPDGFDVGYSTDGGSTYTNVLTVNGLTWAQGVPQSFTLGSSGGTGTGGTGTTGATGPAGPAGPAGTNGTNGTNGAAAGFGTPTASALAAGAAPTITASGPDTAKIFAFGIPAGAPGAAGTNGTNGAQGTAGTPGTAGAAAGFGTPTASALAAGAAPTITASGPDTAKVFAFGIPAGAQGIQGVQGNPGTTGTAGTNGTNGTNGATPLTALAPWATATAYVAGPPASYVSINGSSYSCLVAHTSGTFATDLAAGKWGLVASVGSQGTAGTNGVTDTTAWTAYTPTAVFTGGTAAAVASGVFAYKAIGKTLFIRGSFNITYTTAPTALTLSLPAGFTSVAGATQLGDGLNTTANALEQVLVASAATVINIKSAAAGNPAAATPTTILLMLIIEVQ